MRRAIYITFSCFICLSYQAPAWADALVLEDLQGPQSYHRGQRLPSGSTVIIPEGGHLYFIDDNKNLKHWRGPLQRSIPLGSERPSWFEYFVKLVQPQEYVDSGHTQRALGNHLPAPAADLLDPRPDDVSGREKLLCFNPAQSTRLWYGGATGGFSFTLTMSGRNAEVRGTWPGDQDSLPWPGRLPLLDKASYVFSTVDEPARPFRLIATDALSSPGVAAAEELARLGCRDQALVMLRQLAEHPSP